jgi:RNA polymerase sigma-70 factor, ECF subfamily
VIVGAAEPSAAVGFDAFFREWFPRLVSLGVTMTGRSDVARDVAQESLVRAFRHWNVVGRYDSPGAWTRKVAVNLLLDHLRSVGRERAAVERLAGRIRTTVGEPAVDRWTELVAGLPEGQRVIVTLFYADDLSVGEIAEVMDVASGTVKAQLFKARERLRVMLEEDW